MRVRVANTKRRRALDRAVPRRVKVLISDGRRSWVAQVVEPEGWPGHGTAWIRVRRLATRKPTTMTLSLDCGL